MLLPSRGAEHEVPAPGALLTPPRPLHLMLYVVCSKLPLQDRATVLPWLYAAIDLNSTLDSYDRRGGGLR